MSSDKPQWGPQPSGPYPGGPYPGGPQGAYPWPSHGGPGWTWNAGPGAAGWGGPGWGGAGPQAPGAGPQGAGTSPRIDALDVLEGVLRDGLSLSNFTRIARASGSNFWIGAAIGAGLVVLVNRPDVREAVSHLFGKAASPEPADAAPTEAPKA